MRIAAIADLHCRQNAGDTIREVLDGVQDRADILILAGDLTDTGLPAEADSPSEGHSRPPSRPTDIIVFACRFCQRQPRSLSANADQPTTRSLRARRTRRQAPTHRHRSRPIRRNSSSSVQEDQPLRAKLPQQSEYVQSPHPSVAKTY